MIARLNHLTIARLMAFLSIIALIQPASYAQDPATDELSDGLSVEISSNTPKGTLCVWGGGEVTEKAFRHFRKLVGDGQSIVIVQQSDGPLATAEWTKHLDKNEQIQLLTKSSQSGAKLIELLGRYKGVWLDLSADPQESAKPVIQKLLAAGCVVGGNTEALGSVDRVIFLSSDRKENEATIAARLAGESGMVALTVPQNSLVTLAGRKVTYSGTEPATWHLPAPVGKTSVHSLLSFRQAEGERQDLIALQRAAAARLDPNFPPAVPRPPIVPNGSLLLCGGGDLPDEIWQRFIDLAGGPDSSIVILPIASTSRADEINPKGLAQLKRLGVKDITILTQRSRQDVESPEFARAIKKARGLWFAGGRQWRYVDAYENTVAVKLFQDVLDRGGVIGGTSAGAAIQAEFLVRGSPLNNSIIDAEGYERGFGVLPGTMIDIHVSQRDRLDQLQKLVVQHVRFLGLAIDEQTAAEVKGSELRVVGKGLVQIVNAEVNPVSTVVLRSKSKYDLARRQTIYSRE